MRPSGSSIAETSDVPVLSRAGTPMSLGPRTRPISANVYGASEVGAADELSRRLISLFLPHPEGMRPANRDNGPFDEVTFYEYFDGDTGRGLGASHQTGWTGVVAKLMQQSGERVSSLRSRGRGPGARGRGAAGGFSGPTSKPRASEASHTPGPWPLAPGPC